MTDFVPAQTSVPDWLMTYCRQLADVHYKRRLNRMYTHMLQSFLAYQPWAANPPFDWHDARVHRANGASQKNMGWVPMNMHLPTPLYNKAKASLEGVNLTRAETISMRTFLYTAVVWWCSAVHPYNGPGIL